MYCAQRGIKTVTVIWRQQFLSSVACWLHPSCMVLILICLQNMQGLWCGQLSLSMYSISAVALPLLASSKWHGYIVLKIFTGHAGFVVWTAFSQYVQHPSCGSSPVNVLHVCQWGVCFAVCHAGCGMWTPAKKCSSSPSSLPRLVSTSVPMETSWSSLTARMLPSTMLTRKSVQSKTTNKSVQSKTTKSGIIFALTPG